MPKCGKENSEFGYFSRSIMGDLFRYSRILFLVI